MLINFEREAEGDENNFDSFSRMWSVHTVGCWESAIFSQVTFSQAPSLAEILTPFAVFSPLFFYIISSHWMRRAHLHLNAFPKTSLKWGRIHPFDSLALASSISWCFAKLLQIYSHALAAQGLSLTSLSNWGTMYYRLGSNQHSRRDNWCFWTHPHALRDRWKIFGQIFAPLYIHLRDIYMWI